MSRLASITPFGAPRSPADVANVPINNGIQKATVPGKVGRSRLATAKPTVVFTDRVDPKPYRPEKSVNSVTRMSQSLPTSEPRVTYQYVAGIPPANSNFCPNKNGTLLFAPNVPGNKLTLANVVDAVLDAMSEKDPNAPPDQKAGFHSLSLRLDYPGVPYNLRTVFVDVGRSPVVADSTPRTYAIAAGRIKIAGESNGAGDDPTLSQLLGALRRELALLRDVPTNAMHAWERSKV